MPVNYQTPERAEFFRKKGYWQGDNIGEYLDRAAEQFPDRVGVVDQYRRATWREIKSEVDALALNLLEMGIQPHDRICVQLPNWHQFVVTFCAAGSIGAIPVTLNPALRDAEVTFILQHCEAVAMVIPSVFNQFNYIDMVNRIRPSVTTLQHVITVDHAGGEWSGAHRFADLVDHAISARYEYDYLLQRRPGGDTPSCIMYTSGTTGNPKGVIFTHDSHGYDTRTYCREMRFTCDESIFLFSPLPFQFSIAQALYPAVYCGAKLVIVDRFDVARAFQTIQSENCSFLIGPPATLIGLLDAIETSGSSEAVASVQGFFCGGSHLPAEVVHRAGKLMKCQVFNGYGMTELAAALMTRPGDADEIVANTAGKPFPPALEVKIAREDGSEADLEETGELLFRGPSIFVGYYNNPVANQESYQDNWFCTGDLARKRADSNYVIVGRKKEMINRGGHSIYPVEIEEMVMQHPKIASCAIVGMPDPRLGERCCLFVIPRNGQDITLEEVNTFLVEEKKIARYKQPERMEVVAEFPMLPTGKILKRQLKELIAQKIAAEQASAG